MRCADVLIVWLRLGAHPPVDVDDDGVVVVYMLSVRVKCSTAALNAYYDRPIGLCVALVVPCMCVCVALR
jgi:hypothetical protein